MRHSLLLTIAFLFIFAAQGQTPGYVWARYDTSGKLDVQHFAALTAIEGRLAKNIDGFATNRARMTLTDSGNRISPMELQTPEFPFSCECVLKKDTIFITTAMGMMAGLGMKTAICKDQFGTVFFQEADGTPVFKANEGDTAYADRIYVPAERQKLTLLKRPSFIGNETITGSFEGAFRRFYELEMQAKPPVKRNYKAKLFFTCRLQSVRR